MTQFSTAVFKDSCKEIPAIVIGNGESRLVYDLFSLDDRYCVTLGCNALYRDYSPIFLGSVDEPMIKEIKESSYKGFRIHPKDLCYEGAYWDCFQCGWSTGPLMLRLAAFMGCNPIICIGFDFISTTPRVNNVYAGTANYIHRYNRPTPHDIWMKNSGKVIDEYPRTIFKQSGLHSFKKMEVTQLEFELARMTKVTNAKNIVTNTILKHIGVSDVKDLWI